MTEKPRIDVHQHVTDQIIKAIEHGGGQWQMPWHRPGTHFTLPVNVASRNRYNGINILALWVAAESRGYPHHLWGTFRQWREQGAHVRKGERASLVVFYKEYVVVPEARDQSRPDPDDADDTGKRRVARASWVFNAAQVESFELPVEAPRPDLTERLPKVDAFIASTGARIEHGSQMAYYRPSTDTIHMPDRDRFIGTATSTPTEAYYHTLCHETLHWVHADHRLGSDFAPRTKEHARAYEEIVVELGAAFLSVDLGITPVAREDHAHYIASWLEMLKGDKRAIFAAAAAASRAVAYVNGLQPKPATIATEIAA